MPHDQLDRPTASSPRSMGGSGRLLRIGSAVAVVCALGALLHVLQGPARADDEAKALVDMRYIAITGDGPNARAWYDGAPPSGVPLQTALDAYGKEGYRIRHASHATTAVAGEVLRWSILLERPK